MPRDMKESDDEDYLPPSVAFLVASIALGTLGFQVARRAFGWGEWKFLNGILSEVLLVAGINALIMGTVQHKFVTSVKYSVLTIVIVMFVWDFSTAIAISKNNRQALNWAFPSCLFSSHFRDKYMKMLTSPVEELRTNSAFGDFCGTEFSRTILLAATQLLLLSMFMGGLLTRADPRPPFEDQKHYFYYWMGIIVEAFYIAGSKALLHPFDTFTFFVNALRAADRKTVAIPKDKYKKSDNMDILWSDGYILCHDDWKLWGRLLLCMLVNNAGFALVMAILPFNASFSDDPITFTFRAVSVLFIVEFDDLSHPVEYVIVKLPKEHGRELSNESPEDDSNPMAVACRGLKNESDNHEAMIQTIDA